MMVMLERDERLIIETSCHAMCSMPCKVWHVFAELFCFPLLRRRLPPSSSAVPPPSPSLPLLITKRVRKSEKRKRRGSFCE